jgi:hypothetical protein
MCCDKEDKLRIRRTFLRLRKVNPKVKAFYPRPTDRQYLGRGQRWWEPFGRGAEVGKNLECWGKKREGRGARHSGPGHARAHRTGQGGSWKEF